MNWRAFLRGVGSVVDLFGVSALRVDLPKDDDEAFDHDAKAIRGDWQAVMSDMDRATKSVTSDGIRASGASAEDAASGLAALGRALSRAGGNVNR